MSPVVASWYRGSCRLDTRRQPSKRRKWLFCSVLVLWYHFPALFLDRGPASAIHSNHRLLFLDLLTVTSLATATQRCKRSAYPSVPQCAPLARPISCNPGTRSPLAATNQNAAKPYLATAEAPNLPHPFFSCCHCFHLHSFVLPTTAISSRSEPHLWRHFSFLPTSIPSQLREFRLSTTFIWNRALID